MYHYQVTLQLVVAVSPLVKEWLLETRAFIYLSQTPLSYLLFLVISLNIFHRLLLFTAAICLPLASPTKNSRMYLFMMLIILLFHRVLQHAELTEAGIRATYCSPQQFSPNLNISRHAPSLLHYCLCHSVCSSIFVETHLHRYGCLLPCVSSEGLPR